MKKKIFKAKTDNEFLDQLAFIIFVAGFRYSLVEKRWPAITKAFRKFSIRSLSSTNEQDVARIMESKGMIRNRQKVEAIIQNAVMCREIQKEYGSVLQWIDEAKKSETEGIFHRIPLKERFQEFNRIGETTSGWLANLYSSPKQYVVYEIPGT
ncbi:DNA-3-methyladenine glycosylase I [Candidatus Micrarchaeota archaeon]|nr:DNA-3-methyladenine glycosylase I [Candidatus Micrarchaeota archaeon]